MMFQTLFPLMCLLFGPLDAQAEAPNDTLTMSDFAFSMAIEPDSEAPVQTIILPQRVYQALTRQDQGDMRIYDAAGQEVPHAIRPLASNPGGMGVHGKSGALPFFPISEAMTSAKSGNVTVEVIKYKNGRRKKTTLTLDGEEAKLGEEAVVALIVDASRAPGPIVALHLSMKRSDKSFVLPIQIEASTDLGRWRSIGTVQPLAQLRYETHRIEQYRVTLPQVKAPYLRISWGDQALPVAFRRVFVETLRPRATPALATITLEGTRDADTPNQVNFDLGSAAIPVVQANILVHDSNTLFSGDVKVFRPQNEQPYTIKKDTFFNVLFDGTTIQNQPFKLNHLQKRHWRLVADNKGGGIGQSTPSLALSYYPSQLMFLARGEAPYTLAYGSHKAGYSRFGANEILSILPDDRRDDLPLNTATLGPEIKIGGEAARTKPPPPPPSKGPVVLLWCVLIGGVVVLLWFVRKLAKDLKQTDGA